MMNDAQPTFYPGWQDAEAEAAAKRKLAHARCNLMESALRRVGFSEGTQAWVVAVMIAKISDGWQPFVRDLAILAADKDFVESTKAKATRDRKRILMRALHLLQSWGLLQFTKADGETRRRTRPSKTLTIVIDPRQLQRIISDASTRSEMWTTPGHLVDNEVDNEVDNARTLGGQSPVHSLCIPLSPNPLKSPTTNSLGSEVVVEEIFSRPQEEIDPSWTDVETARIAAELERSKLHPRNIAKAITAAHRRHWSVADVDALVTHWRAEDLPPGALANWLLHDGSAPLKILHKHTLPRVNDRHLYDRQAAELTRASMRKDGLRRGLALWLVQGTIARRLDQDGFGEQVTDLEREAERLLARFDALNQRHADDATFTAHLRLLTCDVGDMPPVEVASQLSELEALVGNDTDVMGVASIELAGTADMKKHNCGDRNSSAQPMELANHA